LAATFLPRLRPSRVSLALALATFTAFAFAAPPYAGRPVQDLLQQLREHELTFIYNTDLVPADLLVTQEPQATSPLSIAAEVLAQHQLELMRISPGTYAIVRQRPVAQRSDPDRAPLSGERLEEIVVSTSRYALATASADVHTLISQQDLGVLPQLGDETLRAVQRLPGAASNGLSGLASIRGGEPNETLILFDGLPLSEPFHLKNFFSPVSLLDSRIVSQMDVHSGGFGSRYGTRMSAVVDARSIRPQTPQYYELGASLFHTNALAARRFANNDGQWLISARRSNLDEIIEILQSDFGEPQYYDSFIRLEYDVSPETRVSTAYLGSRDHIEAKRTSRSEFTQAEYRNNYAWATIDHQWSPASSTRLIASFTDVTNNRNGRIDQPGSIVGEVDDDRFFHVAGLQIDGTYETGGLAHSWGVSARQLSANYEYDSTVRFEQDYPFPGSAALESTRSTRLDPDGYEYAAYWSSRIQLAPKLTVEAGLRWDDETYTDADSETQLAPRASALYQLGHSQRLRVSWGRFFQSQQINEAQLESAPEYFSPAQRADQFVVSYEADLPSGAQLRVETYRKNYTRLRPRWENLFDSLVLVPEIKPDRVLVDPDHARTEGIEILLSRRAGVPWTWWFGYTWSQAKDVVDGREIWRSWDQRHAITAGIHWANERWDLTLADTYHTGWPTTPAHIEGSGLNAQVVVGARNSTRFEDFNSVDLRINRRVRLDLGELDLFLEVTNLFNERNPCCMAISATRTMPDTLVLNREVDHWLGIVPSIGVLWRY
jgi:hypothetical protein